MLAPPQRGLIVGMALYGDLSHDSRVRRVAATLARAGHRVSVVCLADDGNHDDLPEGVRVVVRRPTHAGVLPGRPSPFLDQAAGRLASVGLRVGWIADYARNLRAWGRQAVDACGRVDVWHLHDLTGLVAVAPRVGHGARVIYDAHELFLETGTALRLPWPLRRLLRAYEGRLVSGTSAVVTVNDELAAVLRQRYHPKRIEAVHNCPEVWAPPPKRPDVLRHSAGIPPRAPVILYHGALSPQRGVEQLMEAIRQPGLERVHLVLLGFGEKREDFMRAAASPDLDGRVHVIDPVPPSDLLPWVASADLGAMPIQASTLNHYLSTPNKLFECLAAGTPIVASDFPAMRRIICDNPGGPLGVTCDPSRPVEIAGSLLKLLRLNPADSEALRGRCLAAARDRWNWHAESARLLAVYEDLMREPGACARPD
jgi:glycosyltransferase involved in cell wall biosynthesis